MYCFDSVVRYSEIDAENYMTLPSVLDLLQDCCTFHSEELGIGIDFLRRAGRAWVLSFWQVRVKRFPRMGEKICAYTWPYDFKGFMGSRNFKIEDASRETIVFANSVWSYIDTGSGLPVRVPKEVRDRYVLEPPYEMERAERKIRLPEDMRPREPIRVGRSLIDTNHHVNNGKYVMIAEEYLPMGFRTGELRAEYKKAAVLSDVIYPKVTELDGKVVVSLENESGMPYTIIEFMEDRT